ncbi:hypothetical protein [Mycoplana sp. MJR14]|jgi:hypothetical protein|uniref:hypothetical protein n=1 Tax=Mycoplana sp. MJR14 TaxID=3032583 RepID=UPI000DD64AAC|nr:hypothetical protein [Mycoplana sp. MJR14]MDF1631314.1 hypothetical protein [Mycoplana sp. MJR14]
MSKVVVIGVAGEDGLWVADLGAGTVTRIVDPTAGALQTANELRKSGVTLTKGIDLAVVAQSAASVSGGYMDG